MILKTTQTWNKCNFLIQFFKNPCQINKDILNNKALESFSLKSGAKQGLSLFDIGLKILVDVMRCEAKLIGIAIRKKTKLFAYD